MDAPEESIATLRQFLPKAIAFFTDLVEAQPQIRTELAMKIPCGGQIISGLVDNIATLDIVLEDSFRKSLFPIDS
jgi:hypothetical protein